jgi:hypothetical protein
MARFSFSQLARDAAGNASVTIRHYGSFYRLKQKDILVCRSGIFNGFLPFALSLAAMAFSPLLRMIIASLLA